MIRHKCSTEDELREKRTESWEAPRLDSVLRKHHYHQGGAATVDDFQTASNWTNGPKVTQKTKQQQTRQGHTICYSLALYSCNSPFMIEVGTGWSGKKKIAKDSTFSVWVPVYTFFNVSYSSFYMFLFM